MLVEVTVQGVTPLMLHKFSKENLDTGAKSIGSKQELHPKDQAERCLYKDDEGVLIYPADNLLAAFVDAGRYIKVGKRQLSTRDTTIITSFLNIIESFIPIKSTKGWRVDARGVVNQSTKGRHISYRPLFDDWKLKFTLDIDTSEASLNTVREIIDRAGKVIGIGVMRPSRKGRYGQFKVVDWNEKT
jgi:hypothetical protein